MVFLSLTQRLSQLFVIHRSYGTPIQLHRWNRKEDSDCHNASADLLHFLWRCPKLVHHWHLIIDTINRAFQVNLIKDPLMCALGFLDEEVFPPTVRIPLSILLFLSRKCIASKCLSPIPPTLEECQSQINSTSLKVHHIFQQRGRPRRFEKLWDPWLQTPGSAPLTLVSLWIFQCLKVSQCHNVADSYFCTCIPR